MGDLNTKDEVKSRTSGYIRKSYYRIFIVQSGSNVLHYAAKSGNPEIVKMLLKDVRFTDTSEMDNVRCLNELLHRNVVLTR